jgi:predicted TIM-barrel enzyme
MAVSLEQMFGTTKPAIAMVHFPGLPGRPRHDRAGGRAHVLDVVGRDLGVLQDAGFDGVLFCNEADIPYQLSVGPEIPAAMAAVIGELRSSIRIPFGVNILWDAMASLALARANNTGVQADRLAEILPLADAVIVGTSLKVDGITWNPVDPARARRFTETAAKVRASLAVED